MIHLMRKITNNNHKSITRVAVGAIVGGSSLIYYASNVSVLNPSQHMLRCKWSNMQDQDLFYPAFSHSGASHNSSWFLPFFISRTSFDASPSSSTSSSSPPPPPLPPLPPPPPSSFDIKKKISPSVHGGGSTKHYPRSKCLTRNTIANAAASVNPAVVTLSISGSQGSGTIIDKDGTILTAAHVLFDSSPGSSLVQRPGSIYVTTQDGRTFVGLVEIVDSELDIAILKIQSETPFPYAKLGTSAELRPGDWVIAIGCPCSLNNTITLGIVSCVNRKCNDTGISTEYIQADCSMNPGNSGGPLVNIDGEVVGVSVWRFSTWKYSNKVLATQGLGFYVPIDSVSKIMVENSTRKGY